MSGSVPGLSLLILIVGFWLILVIPLLPFLARFLLIAIVTILRNSTTA